MRRAGWIWVLAVVLAAGAGTLSEETAGGGEPAATAGEGEAEAGKDSAGEAEEEAPAAEEESSSSDEAGESAEEKPETATEDGAREASEEAERALKEALERLSRKVKEVDPDAVGRKLREALRSTARPAQTGEERPVIRVGPGERVVRKARKAVPAEAVRAEGRAETEEPRPEGAREDSGLQRTRMSGYLFKLRDGTEIVGSLDLEELPIDTAYGRLVVPLEDLVKCRFGFAAKEELLEEIEARIRELGSEDFDTREQASEALRKIGPVCLEKLRTTLEETADEEVKSRAEAIIADLEEEVLEAEEVGSDVYYGANDEAETVKFTIRGTIEQKTFQIDTRYGVFDVSKEDVLAILFERYGPIQAVVDVPATHTAAGTWFASGVRVRAGDTITLRAEGKIEVRNYGDTGPQGQRGWGNRYEGFRQAGALLGRIGEDGSPFLVAESHEGEAESDGELFFAIATEDSGEGNKGSFQVAIRVE